MRQLLVPVLLTTLLPAVTAGANALRVPEDYATILAAVDAAAVGDSVLIGPGTWTDRETRTVSIDGSPTVTRANAFLKPWLTVIGTAGATATIVDGDPDVPGLLNTMLVYPDSSPGGPLIVIGLTVRGHGPETRGVLGRGLRSVELRDCVIEGNGTGVDMRNADLIMRNCVVRNQDGSVLGYSGIHSFAIDWFLDGCVFENNVGGQVLFNQDSGGNSQTTIQNCRFTGNQDHRVVYVNGQQPLLIRNNWFEGNSSVGTTGTCLRASNCTGSIVGNTFVDNASTSLPASGVIGVSSAVNVVSNTIAGNVTPPGSHCAGINIFSQEPHQFTDNIVAGCRGGPAVRLGGGSYDPTDGCNIFWDNDSGNFSNYVPQPTDVNVNPLFCDPANLDFTVAANSPCLPGGVPGCGLIGAWGEGCGVVSVTAQSWGRIKSLYRVED